MVPLSARASASEARDPYSAVSRPSSKFKQLCDAQHIESKRGVLRRGFGFSEGEQMKQGDLGADDLRRKEFEKSCRGFWLAYVAMETGQRLDLPDPQHAIQGAFRPHFGELKRSFPRRSPS